MSVRRFILALSAVAVVVLGLERVGVFRFIPEGDLHFEARVLENPKRLSLANDAGDLKGWIRLILVAQSAEPLVLGPLDWSGDPIGVAAHRIGGNQYEVTISKKPNPPGGAPFEWSAGRPLELGVNTKGVGPIAIEDWAVFSSDQESDTLAKARQRWWWTRISWGLLGLSLCGTILTALAEKDQYQAITTQTLIRSIVNTIEGRNRSETKRIRRFLKQVLLDETPVDEALSGVGLSPTDKLRSGPFVARATSLFLGRVNIVRQALDRYVGILTP